MSKTTIKLNIDKVLSMCEEKVLIKMQRASLSFPRIGTTILKKEFEVLQPNPILTGLSQQSSRVTSNVDFGIKALIVRLLISTPYSPFFRFGWGSNQKFGNRDPIRLAIPIIINQIIKQIR